MFPEPIQIATDVWIIPCRIDAQGRKYKPLINPEESDSSSNTTRKSWTDEEDSLLAQIVSERGAKNWSSVAKQINSQLHNSKQKRLGKQCRERWFNHLNPDLLKGQWTEEEDMFIISKQGKIGNKWSEIAKNLSGRTENQVKNRWKSLKKKAEKMRRKELKKQRLANRGKKLKKDSNFFNIPGFLQENIMKDDGSTQIEEVDQTLEFRRNSLEFMNSMKQEEGSIALRISSLTSDPDLQSGKGFDLNNVYSWRGKIDLDYLYNRPEGDKNDFDSCLNGYLKATEPQVWGFDAEAFNPYFFTGMAQTEGDEKSLFEKNFMAGYAGLNMFAPIDAEIFNMKK
jgi:hypothetical protein